MALKLTKNKTPLPPQNGFDVAGSVDKDYDLDKIADSKNRCSNAPLTSQVMAITPDSIKPADKWSDINAGLVAISDKKDPLPVDKCDYKKYLFDGCEKKKSLYDPKPILTLRNPIIQITEGSEDNNDGDDADEIINKITILFDKFDNIGNIINSYLEEVGLINDIENLKSEVPLLYKKPEDGIGKEDLSTEVLTDLEMFKNTKSLIPIVPRGPMGYPVPGVVINTAPNQMSEPNWQMIGVGHSNLSGNIAVYNASETGSDGLGGTLTVSTPIKDNHATTKKYVDTKVSELTEAINKKQNKLEIPDKYSVITTDPNKNLVFKDMNEVPIKPYEIPVRTATGQLKANNPIEYNDLTPKSFVEKAIQDIRPVIKVFGPERFSYTENLIPNSKYDIFIFALSTIDIVTAALKFEGLDSFQNPITSEIINKQLESGSGEYIITGEFVYTAEGFLMWRISDNGTWNCNQKDYNHTKTTKLIMSGGIGAPTGTLDRNSYLIRTPLISG